MSKKLLKFSLVLCASVLMAVSCQSNSNPEGDGTHKPGVTPPAETPAVSTTDTEMQTFLKTLGNVDVNVTEGSTSGQKKVRFAFGDVAKPTKDGNKFTVQEISATSDSSNDPDKAGGTVKHATVIAALQQVLNTKSGDQTTAKIKIEQSDAVTVATNPQATAKKVTFVVTFKDKDNDKAVGTIIIPLDVTKQVGSQSVDFAAQ